MAVWTVKGEAGKAMDATERTMAAIGAIAPKLSFRNLGEDTLSWSVMLDGLAPASEILPESGQVVSLWRNGSRFFTGHAAPVRQRGRVVGVTIHGPWWWLERIYLESLVTDDTAATADRNTYALPKQSLTTSLNSLLTQAIAKGAPVSIGTLATTFSAPEIRLNQMSFAQAISEVVRITPDMVFHFDYSTATPTANTVRRKTGLAAGSAADLSLDAETLEDFEVNPLVELQVSQVKIPYVQRAADGGKQFAAQTSGTAATGKVQILTVSGDEMDTFLPKDLLDTVAVQSTLWTSADLAIRDNAIKSMVEQYGPFKGASVWFDSQFTWFTGSQDSKQLQRLAFNGLVMRSNSGSALPSPAYLVLSTDPLPEWAQTALGAVEVTITGTYMVAEPYDGLGWSALYAAMKNGAAASGGPVWLSGDRTVTQKYYWLARPVTVTGWVIAAAYPTLTDVYRPSDYDFISPPSGFADGLLAAQNYLAYDGSLSFTEEECGTARYLQKAVSLTHSQTAHATMRAMLSGEDLDLQSGATTLLLGAPARFSYRDLVNRIRGNSNSNIVYL